MMKKFTLMAVCALSAWLAFQWEFGDQIITEGEFRGIRIGEEKSEIFESLKENKNIGAVSGIDKVTSPLRLDGFAKAFEFNDPSRIRIVDGNAALILDFKERRLELVQAGAVYTVDIVAVTGSPWNEVKQKIILYLQMNPAAYVLASSSGYGHDYNKYQVLLHEMPNDAKIGNEWLMRQDIWGFHYLSDFSYTRLEFQGAFLKKIIHRDRQSEFFW